MAVKFAEYPERTCREPVTLDGLTDHACSLREWHPGPHCPASSKVAIARREQWEADHPGWEQMIKNDDPFKEIRP
jgi:hypothetical protein